MLALVLIACKPTPTPTDDPVEVTSLDFARDGVTLVSIPIEGLELGTAPVTDSAGREWSYNPAYSFQMGVRWHVPDRATRLGDVVTLDYGDGLSATVTFEEDGPQSWAMRWVPSN